MVHLNNVNPYNPIDASFQSGNSLCHASNDYSNYWNNNNTDLSQVNTDLVKSNLNVSYNTASGGAVKKPTTKKKVAPKRRSSFLKEKIINSASALR